MTDGEDYELTPEEKEANRLWWLESKDLLSRHFGDAHDLEWMSHLLDFDFYHEIPEVWDEREVYHLLNVLELATEEIAYIMSGNLPMLVGDSINFVGIDRVREKLGEKSEQLTSEEMSKHLNNDPCFRLIQAWEAVAENAEHVHTALESARKTAGEGFRTGRKNIEAWRMVSAAAKLCETRYPGVIAVPRYMNEAGPFYALLVDLFHHYEIEGDPVSAFRAWRRYVDSYEAKKGYD